MKRTFFSMAIFSFLTFSLATYGEDSFNADSIDEALSSEQSELLSLEEDLDLEDQLSSLGEEETLSKQQTQETELEAEILSLEEEILTQEETPAVSSPTLSQEISKTEISPELIEELSPTLTQSPIPLFSSLEEETPLILSQIEEVSVEPNTMTIANLFPPAEQAPPVPLEVIPKSGIEINLMQVLSGSPLIYLLLFSMSLSAIAIWLYSMISLKSQATIPDSLTKEIRNKLLGNDFQEASSLCDNNKNLFSKIVAAGLSCRKYGLQAMVENMQSEGKKATIAAWQRLSLLHDIVIIAPMLGLLGTVLGMFYAFYDLNRSLESVTNLFDGFGISVGTTVAGIGVAILAMILHSTAKFRLVRALARVENEATSLAHLMDEKN